MAISLQRPALYVVATPIGNLEDISLRALAVLREVDLVAAEDTRSARRLLSAHGIRKPVTSFFRHSPQRKLAQLVADLRTKAVALLSEAGTPGVSDPGQLLVAAALEQGVPVIPIPGPSALTAAISVAGVPSDRFLFLGFLPRRHSQRIKLLAWAEAQGLTLVAYEAPHRLRACLEDIAQVFGGRPILVARELTKLHEELFRGSASEALAHFQEPRGEFTLVIAGQGRVEPGTHRVLNLASLLATWGTLT